MAKKKVQTAAKKKVQTARKKSKRTPWIGRNTPHVLIDGYARKLKTFLKAMEDGIIDDNEIAAQEQHVIDLMKQVEPELGDELHQAVTRLLCELTAYNVMQTIHSLQAGRPKSVFRG
jgi:hypothetical protein